MVSRIEAGADVELAEAVRLMAEQAVAYPDDKMLEIIANLGKIAGAARNLEQITGRANSVGETAIQASVQPAISIYQEEIEPQSTPIKPVLETVESVETEDLVGPSEILESEQSAEGAKVDEILAELNLPERYRPALAHLVENPSQWQRPAELRSFFGSNSDRANEQAFSRMMRIVKASKYSSQLETVGSRASREYSWLAEPASQPTEPAETSGAEPDAPETAEPAKPTPNGLNQSEAFISQYYDDELEIEPEDVEVPPVEAVQDHGLSPNIMPSRLPEHPVKPLDTRSYYETSRRLAIVDDEPEEAVEVVPEEPTIEPEKEDEFDKRLQELNIDYSENGIKIKGIYLDIPSRVATLLADIASYKKGITFEELVKGIKYDKTDKYARINVGKHLSTDIKTIKTVLADFADELVFSDETYTRAQFGGGHNKQERLLTVLRPDEVRTHKKSPESGVADEEDEDKSFLA